MSELKYKNTPLQYIKHCIEAQILSEQNRVFLDAQEIGERDYAIVKLENILAKIAAVEKHDQDQAEQAENWSWRNGDDMGR